MHDPTDLRDPIGQLFMVDFTGYEPSPEIERLIVQDGVGGIILFVKNVATPHQTALLTNRLQAIAREAGHPPLLVSADQEGGPVVRLREGATHFPSAMAFGAAGSEALAAAAAGVTARELRAVGIHMNMAPVLDVNSNPANPVIGTRSFGEDPALVSRLGVAALRALQAAGVLATVKHFPGHGDTLLDSHLDLPAVSHPRARLDAVELAPFRAAVRAGVGAVMPAHVVYRALDPERPATLSPAVMGLLRTDLGFSGLVVTDSMAMRAISDRLTPGEAAVRALLAGADLILACGPLDAQREAIEAVRRAASDGRLPPARLAQAAAAVRSAKDRLGLAERAVVSLDRVAAQVGIREHLAVADRVAEAAATIVQSGGRKGSGVIPLPSGRVDVIGLDAAGPAEPCGDELPNASARLAWALREAGRDATPVSSTDRPHPAPGVARVMVLGAAARAGDADAAARGAELVARARGVLAHAVGPEGPTVVVSVGSPYLLAGLPPDLPCLAVYGADPPSITAAARVLAGAAVAGGRLPVTLPEPGHPSAKPIG